MDAGRNPSNTNTSCEIIVPKKSGLASDSLFSYFLIVCLSSIRDFLRRMIIIMTVIYSIFCSMFDFSSHFLCVDYLTLTSL